MLLDQNLLMKIWAIQDGPIEQVLEARLEMANKIAIQKSYKKECQEKNLPHRLNAAPCLGIQPPTV